MERRVNSKLKAIYYSPESKGSFGGVNRLHKESKTFTRRQIQDWLMKQDVYTLHKPIRRKFRRSRILVSSIDDVWQMDLVDMQKFKHVNKKFNFLLTCIDVFSKYAWAIPIKNKTGLEIVKAMKKILKSGRAPMKIHTDSGLEFKNRIVQAFLKKKKIGYYTTHSDVKAAVVERFNRTLKSRMWRYFTFKGNYRYIGVLPSLLKSYNNSYHRTIKTSPALVSHKNSLNVFKAIYSPLNQRKGNLKPGDQVRISKLRNIFAKGYLPNWTDEIFVIVKKLKRDPKSYIIKDTNGEEIKGAFYEEELQKVKKQKSDFWRIEKVLKERIKNRKKQVFVKWMGYSDENNSWVNAKDIIKLKNGIK